MWSLGKLSTSTSFCEEGMESCLVSTRISVSKIRQFVDCHGCYWVLSSNGTIKKRVKDHRPCPANKAIFHFISSKQCQCRTRGCLAGVGLKTTCCGTNRCRSPLTRLFSTVSCGYRETPCLFLSGGRAGRVEKSELENSISENEWKMDLWEVASGDVNVAISIHLHGAVTRSHLDTVADMTSAWLRLRHVMVTTGTGTSDNGSVARAGAHQQLPRADINYGTQWPVADIRYAVCCSDKLAETCSQWSVVRGGTAGRSTSAVKSLLGGGEGMMVLVVEGGLTSWRNLKREVFYRKLRTCEIFGTL
ncbi:hypothetical protein J6590_071383 [Homalodisca vitripennis]|nr:hypothetical protein J6590_071383 [Homalodisca vitripennis]